MTATAPILEVDDVSKNFEASRGLLGMPVRSPRYRSRLANPRSLRWSANPAAASRPWAVS